MQDVGTYIKFISKVIGEYNRYLRDEKGIFPSDLMHLSIDENDIMSMCIINPCVDPIYETTEVDPVIEYGIDYIKSDFNKSELVKSLVEKLGEFIDDDYKNRPIE